MTEMLRTGAEPPPIPQGPSRAEVLQRRVTLTKEFKQNKLASETLKKIQELLEESNADFEWAVKSPDLEVAFKVANTEDAHGTTQLFLGKHDLAAAALQDPSSVARLLKNPQRLRVEICLDRELLTRDNLGEIYMTLAHEIGVHLTPRLKFVRQAVEKGGITEHQLNQFLLGVLKEHEDVFHPPLAEQIVPKNTTYLQLMLAFASVIPDEETRTSFLSVYMSDVERYDPRQGEEDSLQQYMVRMRLMKDRLQKITLGASVVVLVMAILAAMYMMSGE